MVIVRWKISFPLAVINPDKKYKSFWWHFTCCINDRILAGMQNQAVILQWAAFLHCGLSITSWSYLTWWKSASSKLRTLLSEDEMALFCWGWTVKTHPTRLSCLLATTEGRILDHQEKVSLLFGSSYRPSVPHNARIYTLHCIKFLIISVHKAPSVPNQAEWHLMHVKEIRRQGKWDMEKESEREGGFYTWHS